MAHQTLPKVFMALLMVMITTDIALGLAMNDIYAMVRHKPLQQVYNKLYDIGMKST